MGQTHQKAKTLEEALDRSLGQLGVSPGEPLATATVAEISNRLKDANVDVETLLSAATLVAHSETSSLTREFEDTSSFVANASMPEASRQFGSDLSLTFTATEILSAVVSTNLALRHISDLSAIYRIDLFELLGLRNLSSFVGESFRSQLEQVMRDRVLACPNQDGHPDLLALTEEGRQRLAELEADGEMTSKSPFSPFPFGGIEVKATCGNTPPASELPKPKIGESRSEVWTTLDWKAHHRDTNYLVGLVWDFHVSIPAIVAAFFRNDLTTDDWGKTVTPKEGSRTTSVSIMKRSGVKRMAEGWVVMPVKRSLTSALRSAMGSKSDSELQHTATD